MTRPLTISRIIGVALGSLVCATIGVAVPKAGWNPLGISTDRMPRRQVALDQPGRTVLDIEIPGVEVAYRTQQAVMYQQVSLPYGGTTHEVGKPALPLITELVAIPDQGNVTVKVLEVETASIADVNVYPFLKPPLRDGNYAEPEFVLDKEIYQGRKSYPSDWATASTPVIWRDVRLAPVIIYPVRWNPDTKELSVATRMRIEVITEGAGGSSVKQRHASTVSSRFARMYQDRVINWSSHSGGLDLSSEGTLLIITHPDFHNSMLPFANWKHQKGFQTSMVSLDEIGQYPTPQQIKEYIHEAYYTWSTPPEYVILVGDYNLMPWWTGLEGSRTDHKYATLEGDDYIADVVIGRFSVETAAECDILVSKLVDYERNPYVTENGWYDAGIVVSSDDGVDPENGIKARQMFLNAGFSIVDHFQEPVNNQLTNMVNSLNDGRSWVFYIGHGNPTSWGTITPYLTNTNVNALTNGRMLPAIVSIACANADLDYSGGDCFAETWMTTAVDRGASNIFAFTENSVFYYTDTLGLGIMRSHFELGTPYFGDNVDYGRMYMFQSFPEGFGGTTELTMQQAMLVGDPTQLVWSDNPGIMAVEHPVEIQSGHSIIPVTVTSNGQPVEDALVCAMMESEEVYEVGTTNGAGLVVLEVEPQGTGELTLTVTSENAMPYETTIQVLPVEGPYVIYQAHAINDSLGNSDGLLDLGETAGITLTVQNLGIEPASDLTVVLHTSNPHVVITDSTEDFGTVPPGVSATQDGYSFHAGYDLSDGEAVGIEVIAEAAGGAAWSSAFTITGHAPEIVVSGVEVEDQSGNGRLEPGESGSLIITLSNAGSSTAPNVIATLASPDPLITIHTSSQHVGDIPSSGMATAVFSVTAGVDVPPGSAVTFDLDLSAQSGYSAELSFSEFVGQLAAYLWEPDETPISAQAVASVLTSLGLDCETGTTFPADLERYASVWVFLGMWNHNYVLSGSQGINLANYLDGGGSLYMEGGDTWAYDEQTAVHSYFHIEGVNDGWSDLTAIQGIAGTMTAGMVFGYNGENSFVDRIAPREGAQLIFNNWNPSYGTTVAYDQGTYRTIGASFELGGLADGNFPCTKANLIAQYLSFFHVTGGEDHLPPVISHDPLPNQSEVQSPYHVQAAITDLSGVAEARLYYSLNNLDYTSVVMGAISNDVFAADIPGQPAGTTINYYIEATDGSPASNTGSTAVYRFVILLPGSQTQLLASDFEADNGQLTVSLGSDWQWGNPSSGPHSAHSGTRVWGTNLTGNYSPNANATLDTPPIDLRNIVSPILSIWQWYSFESSGGHLWDGGNVKVSVDGGAFEVLDPVGGYDGVLDNPQNPLHGEEVFGSNEGGYWHQRTFDLTRVAGHVVVIRFHMGSDGSNQEAGWYIDDILIQGSVFGPPPAIDDLTIQIVGNDARLTWSPSTGAYEYRIYRSPEPNFVLGPDSYLATAIFPNFQDVCALLSGSSYFYRVIAVSEYGMRGAAWETDPNHGSPINGGTGFQPLPTIPDGQDAHVTEAAQSNR